MPSLPRLFIAGIYFLSLLVSPRGMGNYPEYNTY